MKQLVVKNREIGTGKPLICVPVMEKTREKIITEINQFCCKNNEKNKDKKC